MGNNKMSLKFPGNKYVRKPDTNRNRPNTRAYTGLILYNMVENITQSDPYYYFCTTNIFLIYTHGNYGNRW